MICPKCKSKVSKEDTVCKNCNLRLVFKCPRCGFPTRLGSVSCQKCGYTFVKFCPKCHSANYASSSTCRKCSYEFENENTTPIVENDTKEPDTSQKQETIVEEEITPLIFYIDFTNLEKIFEKYNKADFRQKVAENIKTTIKIVFGTTMEFVDSHTVKFTFNYSKSINMLVKINQFEVEFNKFNDILEKTLAATLTYKFAVSTLNEARDSKDNYIAQLKYGIDKDVIVSNGTYGKLNSDLSLIKISPDSYKMIFLEQKPVFEQSEDEKYDKALETILENISKPSNKTSLISLNAPRGAGKTHLLNDLYFRIGKSKLENTVVLYAQCSALTQVSPYGLIQSFFTRYFDFPLVLKEEFNQKNFEKKVLDKLGVDKMDEETLSTLANLIYPIKKDYFENILINKEITFKYMKDVFDCLRHKKSVIFIIDDFDLIDESSLSFLKYLVNEDYFERDSKMVVAYKNEQSATVYFQTNKLNNTNCLNISLRPFGITECKDYAKKILGQEAQVPVELLSDIALNAQGNIAYIEQIIEYLFEKRYFVSQNHVVMYKKPEEDFEIPKTLEQCFFERLDFLKSQSEEEYSFILVASLLGDKPDYTLLKNVFTYDDAMLFSVVEGLDKKGYLKRKFDDIYEFKNSLTWSYCYIRAKEDSSINSYTQKLLNELLRKTTTSPLICSILAQIAGENSLAFELWTRNLQYASYIGDTNIYIMAQKQSLILLENVKLDNFEFTKNNIMERLGKLLYEKNPVESMDYLTNVLVSAQKNDDINKIIDLSGFIVKSSYVLQDYSAVVEIVDNVLKYFVPDKKENKKELELQKVLIKTRKLKALLQLGLWEEIASLVNSEINPVLQKYLNIFSKNTIVSQNEIFSAWIESNIILAQSYAIQGSSLSFELISEIEKVIGKEKSPKTDYLKVNLAYATAIANTSKGYFKESDTILQNILKDYSYIIDSPALVSKWNIINIINKILKLDVETIKQELFEAAAYADNSSDEVSKHMLKTLLAYVYLEEKSYLKAIEIATGEMQYFSSKKIAFGALLAWYVSAAATAGSKADMYCIEICEKAVKICENAQNNNYYFKILFQELLAKAYLKLNDKENARMYCDLALQSANANELLYLQVRLNALKVEIAREKLAQEPEKSKYNYAQNVIRMYNRTIELAKKLELDNYVKKIEKELTSFKAHCQLNRIIEDK